ncbi:hypothetical protein KAH55_15115, partial [bacterium]|nr:hypothetical protein [bacterium]
NYIELKNYPAALRLAEIGLEHVPDSRFFLWIQAEAARMKQDWEMAATVYQKIMGSYHQLVVNNHYNEAVCYLRLAEISWAQQEYETVWHYCERGLQLPLAPDIAHRLQGNQKELIQLQAAALEKFHSIH